MDPKAKVAILWIGLPLLGLYAAALSFAFTVRRYGWLWLCGLVVLVAMVLLQGLRQKRLNRLHGFVLRSEGREAFIDCLHGGTRWLSIYCELAGGKIDRIVHLSEALSAIPKSDREAFEQRIRAYLAASGVRAEFV